MALPHVVPSWHTRLLLAPAVRLRDNRAFCTHACPVAVAVVVRLTARPALVKVVRDASACASCRAKACVAQCPSAIDVPGSIANGQRILVSECNMCQRSVAVWPPNTLAPSVGFDLGGEERLRERIGT